ncbi:MAG: NAD(P)/FAD-dependent oxidoreductase [Arthrobacter sp.]|jgi:cation diffusion facilitator CzcD-associated flavoprotein CzcO|nr:NAD(P)/FAD-dependent oxidoreductase [Arthrobacter sp.]
MTQASASVTPSSLSGQAPPPASQQAPEPVPAPVLTRDVVIIGAGQAGLSAAHFLRSHGLVAGHDLEVLDANPTPGGAWSHRWDALTFDDAHGIHDLPGAPLGDPDPREPAREVVKRYFGAYEAGEQLSVQRPWRVTSVERDGAGYAVSAAGPGGARRRYLAGSVINGTGTWDRPFIPHTAGRFGGRQLTTRDFTDPEAFAGRRVLVVGGGTSAVQFVLLLEAHGVETVWSTRTPPRWTPLAFDADWGRAVEQRVSARTRGGLPPLSVVAATGLPLIPRYVAGIERGVLVSRGPLARLTPGGVDFADGGHEDVDVILWATGFRASLGHLAPLALRAAGGGVEMADDDVSVVGAPGLFLVGYGPSASTIGATRAGRRAARGALARVAALRGAAS